MSQAPPEQPDARRRPSNLIQFLCLVGLIALLHAPIIAAVNRLKGQVEETNQRIQGLEEKLDQLKDRQRP
jgi:Tfp pilus assembly protein PilN